MYRVGQIKWHHFTFLLVTCECIHKILWFLAHINYIMQKMRRCHVYVIMSTLIRQRALQTRVLSICITSVLRSFNFLHWNSAFLHSLVKFYSKQKFVWFCFFLVIFIIGTCEASWFDSISNRTSESRFDSYWWSDSKFSNRPHC